MSLHSVWILPVGFLALVGTLGCGVERTPVAEPEPIAEPPPWKQERAAAMRAIYSLGGKYRCGGPIVNVNLSRTPVTDADLAHLSGLTTLKRLYLTRTWQVTDAALEHLEGLTNLRILTLDDTDVTDAGLEHLKKLTRLTKLDLCRTRVTDAG